MVWIVWSEGAAGIPREHARCDGVSGAWDEERRAADDNPLNTEFRRDQDASVRPRNSSSFSR